MNVTHDGSDDLDLRDPEHLDPNDPQFMTRRQLLRHTAWFGAAVGLSVVGGEVISHVIGDGTPPPAGASLRFAQVSDSHIGFHGAANMDVTATFNEAINQINGLGYTPDFVIHTGDLTQLSKAEEFDQVKQMMTGLSTRHVFAVPGEHDTIDYDQYRQHFGAGTRGDGWYSFDIDGVHVIALVNTLALNGKNGLGHLGREQLEFIEKDVAHLSSDTPIIVFSHIPLFEMYPQWGWGTDDATQALSYLKRFASVTCLNGHVHQLFSKTEGNITFHSGFATAFPQPKPGEADQPGPLVVPARKLHSALGVRTVDYLEGKRFLAVKDRTLA